MRTLIIVTLIIIILTVYFRYENFQINNSNNILKFPFFKFTSYKKKTTNPMLSRINGDIGYYKKFDDFFSGKNKNFILPGTFKRPVRGTRLLERVFIPRPKISYTEEE